MWMLGSMDFTFDTPSIAVVPYLMSTLSAINKLAVNDFTQSVGPTTYSPKDYPSVSIVSEGTVTTDTIETLFLVWAIWKGVRLMIATNNFQNLLRTLEWNTVVVGYVMFVQSGPQLAAPWRNDGQIVSQRSESSPALNDTAYFVYSDTVGTVDPTNDQSLKVSFAISGSDLSIFQVFMNKFAPLAYVAELSKTQPMRDLRLSPALYDTTVAISRSRKECWALELSVDYYSLKIDSPEHGAEVSIQRNCAEFEH